MEALFTNEVENAIKTKRVYELRPCSIYYVDELQDGKFGISFNESPLIKLDTIDEAHNNIMQRIDGKCYEIDIC